MRKRSDLDLMGDSRGLLCGPGKQLLEIKPVGPFLLVAPIPSDPADDVRHSTWLSKLLSKGSVIFSGLVSWGRHDGHERICSKRVHIS